MYKVGYDTFGNPRTIDDDEQHLSIQISEDNREFRKFLEWNKQQKKPLDYISKIEPVKPIIRDLEKEIDNLKSELEIAKIDIANLKSKAIK